MAWIYLAESAESVLPYRITSGRSPTVRTTDTLSLYFYHAWQTGIYESHQSGMTSVHLQDLTSTVPSILSTEVFHARTSLLQEMESAWQASGVDFSSRLSDLQKKLIRRLCSSKTSQQLELEDFEKSSEHLPIFGMTVGGLVFLPKRLEPVTCEEDGSCLPTPVAHQGGHNQGGGKGRTGKIRPSLATMASKGVLPTPKARDFKAAGGAQRNSLDLPGTMGGPLNPQFVEEIMGYQIGWTELKDWATQWYRSRQKSHLKD